MIWYLYLLLLFQMSEAKWCSFGQAVQPPPFEVAFGAPNSFGRTHFIVGYSEDSSIPALDEPEYRVKQQTSIRTFFSPDDDVRAELVKLIDREQRAIHAAVYIITEPEIAKAITRARKRNVLVELVTDVGCLKEKANKVSMLCDTGCKLFVYNPPAINRGSSLMHHKFALFSSNNGLSYVWTGSYNFTKAASKTNQENAVIISDNKTFDQFMYQFKRLKERSYRYGRAARA